MLPATPSPRGSAVRRKFPPPQETSPWGNASRTLDTPSSPLPAAAHSSPVRTPLRPPAPPLEAATPFSKRLGAGDTLEVLNQHIPKPVLPLPDVSADADSRVNFLFNTEIRKFAYRPMYQKLSEASEVQDERIDEFAATIQEHYGLADDAFGDPALASPAEVVAVGRIVSDSLEGKFNPSSVVLESSRMTGAGARVPLKLEGLPSFAFFPGQVVAVRGVNASGGYFQVHQVLDPPKLPAAATATAELVATAARLAAGPLSVFVAAGPYTTQDNLEFEALEELCARAADQRPDVVILAGPFVDSEHPLVRAGDFDLYDVDAANDGTVDDLFRERISRRIQRITHSMVILIPSLRDAVSRHCSFPQEPLKRKFLKLPDVRFPVPSLPSAPLPSLNSSRTNTTRDRMQNACRTRACSRSTNWSLPCRRTTSCFTCSAKKSPGTRPSPTRLPASRRTCLVNATSTRCSPHRRARPCRRDCARSVPAWTYRTVAWPTWST